MQSFTLGQAAKATGKVKGTILDAIKNGRLSATRNDRNQWQINPAELFRIYPPIDTTAREQPPPLNTSTDILLEKIKYLEEQLAVLNGERDRERGKDTETINDLRQRLDREGEERRRTQAQLTALLTDQRERTPAPTTQAPPSGNGFAGGNFYGEAGGSSERRLLSNGLASNRLAHALRVYGWR